jgi:hypothetical protein
MAEVGLQLQDAYCAVQVDLLMWDGPRGGEAVTLAMAQDGSGVWTAQVMLRSLVVVRGTPKSCECVEI